MKNEIDKFRHLAWIQKEKRNAVAHDYRDVVIILRQLKFKKKVTEYQYLQTKQSFRTDVRFRKQKERQNQIIKF